MITVTLYDLKIDEVRTLGQAEILLYQLCLEIRKFPLKSVGYRVVSEAHSRMSALSCADPKKIAKIFKDLNIEIEEIKR